MNIADKHILKTLLNTYTLFLILLFISYVIAHILLPEGALKNFPFLSSVSFKATTKSTKILNTFVLNMGMICIIIASNLFRVRNFSFGYLPLYANTVILGLFAGSNSFSGSISTQAQQEYSCFSESGSWSFLPTYLHVSQHSGFPYMLLKNGGEKTLRKSEKYEI